MAFRDHVFLKHADRDPNGFLSPDGLDNQKYSCRRATAYIGPMHQTATEISAYVAFWSVMNDQVNDLTDEVQLFARQLQTTEKNCDTRGVTNYIRDSNTNGLP